jgi:hypothetical protein
VFCMDVAKLDRDVAYVAKCSWACCSCFRGMLQAFVQNILSISDVCYKRFLSGCCICFTYKLQEYVRNVSAILVLCCNKCFHVASCKCFIWILPMFHSHVEIVYFKCFIYFRRMLHSRVLCCKCLCFRGMFRESWGTPWVLGEGA